MIANPFLMVMGTALILSLLHVFYFSKDQTLYAKLRIIFLYQVFFTIGVNSVLAFYAHYFRGEETARYIGWLPHNPFQKEVAFANLTIGILALCAPFMGIQFWLGTILALTIWYWGDAYVHYMDYHLNGNVSPGNIGIPFYMDVFLPIFFIIFIGILYSAYDRSGQTKK